MTNNQKYLVVGGLAAVAVYWWWSNHATASAQIVAQPRVPTSAMPSVSSPAVGVSLVDPVGTSTTADGRDRTQLNALLAWSAGTKNPPLYQAMINALTPDQLDRLYGILTTQWDTGAAPTVANTAFWNQLRIQYPFLNTGGQGCDNFECI